MDKNRQFGMIAAYYLSRFDEEGVANLGYSTQNEAFYDIAEKLNVKRNTVKNWRDEFDPLHPFRVGWYQRPMTQSRVKVVEVLQDLDEYAIRLIVKDILQNPDFEESKAADEISRAITVKDEKKIGKGEYVLRGPTGKKAEDFFIDWFASEKENIFQGQLEDTRDLGCGYDFKIVKTNGLAQYVEVKGLASESGGITMTNKEWVVARAQGKQYYIFLVRNIDTRPQVQIIPNPSQCFEPVRREYTTIQVSWGISDNQIKNMSDG